MEKILVSIPEQLAVRLRAAIPARQRSQVIAQLISKEVAAREKQLYECALAIEQDAALNKEMSEWNTTLGDGLNEI
jgi:hypothetical protein